MENIGFEIALIIVAGISNAIMDRSALNRLGSRFWNKGEGWTYKYKNTLQEPKNHWWYFGLYEPEFQEKFPFSSTIFVFLTDGWHLMQFIMLTALQLIMTINVDFVSSFGMFNELVELIIVKALFGSIFQIVYSLFKP